MNRNFNLILILCIFFNLSLSGQIIKGKITNNGDVLSFVNIVLKGSGLGTSSNEDGVFEIVNSPLGNQNIIISALGMHDRILSIDVKKGINTINIELEPSVYNLDQVVITGTKTFKRKTDSPVIVNIIDSRQLNNVQACNLAEGLNFQPAIRVETDCQTCNYTQLRMNGLGGGYSQILINGRPIFSPLTGLYGMEQIPANMIDRIEVVRGGGSSLYGSSAIGGVVNVITKLAKKDDFNFGYNYGLINNKASDAVIFGNTTLVAENKNLGATFFINNRKRDWYDHNNDKYSELPTIKNNSFGANFFFLPGENQKLEMNIGSLHEYRYGGEMLDIAAHLAMQSEERLHDILLGNIDYQINFNNNNSSFIIYLAAQQTQREHYTGIRPELGSIEDNSHLTNPPYGTSLNNTKQIGLQLNHKYEKFIGSNIFTLGSDYLSDNIMDKIPAYKYLIDQKINTIGLFLQSDWDLTKNINLLSGARLDRHSFLDNIIISPRMSLLYKLQNNKQLRLSYSTGFRAPQAFDTDLHISFAGGGISRIELAKDLKEERSRSLSASVNYDKAKEYYIYGFTLESFYTVLDDAFFQEPAGVDSFGDIFIKRNGRGAIVKGLTVDLRLSYNNKLQIESGLTIQKSLYDEAIVYSNDLRPKREFLRTPEKYGYITASYSPSARFTFVANLVHTGAMSLVHMAGAPEQLRDEYQYSDVFNVIGLKATFLQSIKRVGVGIEYSIGVKNLANAYQNNFDSGKNRDSNFIYGPSNPRTFYFNIVLKAL